MRTQRIVIATCLSLLLASCVRAGNLRPSEVLTKATDASQNLDSAMYTIDASFHGNTDVLSGNLDGKVSIAGNMTNAGHQLAFSLKTSIDRLESDNQSTHIDASGDFVIGGEKDVYMKVDALTVTPPNSLITTDLISHLLNQWWLIPTESGSQAPASNVAPDPAMLRMQTSVISVLKDRGLTDINGHTAYLYDVTIDPEKMRAYITDLYKKNGKTPSAQELTLSTMNAKGMIWIDAQTFVIHRIVWDIASTEATHPLQVHLDVTISDHNKPVTITLPTNATPFPSIKQLTPETVTGSNTGNTIGSGSGSSASSLR